MTQSTVRRAANAAEGSTTVRTLARTGYAVLGLLHVMIGGIAISIAVGAGGGEADQSGAMKQLSETAFGGVVLWIITVGLFALGLWQIVATALVRENDPKKKWGRRVLEASKAVAYIALAITSLIFALGGSKSQSGSTKSLSAGLIAAPGGVFVVVLIGLVTIGVAIGFAEGAFTRSFAKRLSLPRRPFSTVVLWLGSTGYLAKGVALAIVGILFVVAAVTLDPDKASGLDGALKALTKLPFGEVLLWIVGVGLIAYGAFCFARAAFERL